MTLMIQEIDDSVQTSTCFRTGRFFRDDENVQIPEKVKKEN